MKRRLVEGKGAEPCKVTVIHNWADCHGVAPGPRDNPFARQQGLVDRFVVLHAGNIGLSQNLEIVLHAAEQLREQPDVVFVFVGDGAKKKDLQEIAVRRDLRNVMFLPFQPRELMDQSYATADVSLVSLKRGLAGVIVPSKVYNVLASGRPCIAAVEQDCEVADIIHRHDCGFVVGPGDASALRARILELAADRDRAVAMACGRVAPRCTSTVRDKSRRTTPCSARSPPVAEARFRCCAFGDRPRDFGAPVARDCRSHQAGRRRSRHVSAGSRRT
jgi:glycosyltransferase involved in cell wall biosynthesis